MVHGNGFKSSWVSTIPAKGNAYGRLFCFPFAGGGIAVYYPWRELLLEDIELVRIQLPGREIRLREKPFTSIESLVQTIAKEIMPLLDLPFSFFGHSMGALIAFELARELRRTCRPIPMHLFVSGRRAPQLPDTDKPFSDLPDDEFVDRLCQYQGMPEMVLQNPELMELFLPILRADFRLLNDYSYKEEPPLAFPITAFGGLSDPKISREDVLAWECQSSVKFESLFFGGGHFFLNEYKKPLLDHINAAFSSSLLSN